jgi:predicted nucleotidyltransferase
MLGRGSLDIKMCEILIESYINDTDYQFEAMATRLLGIYIFSFITHVILI